MSTVGPLAGYTIAITASRRREEFGAALQRRDAKVVYAPSIQLVPLADDTQLLEATKRCLAAPVDIVVATTGIGFRGWMEAADTWGLAESLVGTLGRATLIARGPKARGAIRASGLHDAWSPASESSSEVLEHLLAEYELEGRRVVVQLHGEPLPDMVQTLRAQGADVIEVPVYRWIPPTDPAPLHRLVESVAAGGVDSVAFTSAPAAASFLSAADETGYGGAVRTALRDSVVPACVGPVTAGPLLAEDIPVITPARSRLGALVREIVEQVPARRGRLLPVAGHELDVRGHAVVIDGRFVPLSAANLSLLRELIRRPGQVVARADLLKVLPGEGNDEHAVEMAVGRLRSALDDPRTIQTVVKRGYRLAYEPERADRGDWRY